MTGHPDPDVLAELREGLLGRRQAARIRSHLTGCGHCAAVDRGLAEVSTLLASAPPPAMPTELTDRLRGVLAAEAAARAAGPGPATQPDRHRGRAPTGPGRRRQRLVALRVASATAVLAVLAAAGFGLSQLVPSGGQRGSSATSSRNGPLIQHETGPGGTSNAMGPDEAGPRNGPDLRLSAGRVPVVRSGTDYQPGRLAAEAAAVLARYPAHSANSTVAPAATGAASSGPVSSSALRGCVALVTGGTLPRLVDQARYQGRPATVIVQVPVGGHTGHVWVVGPACSASQRDLIAHTALTAAG